jgi:hypothetical protein
MRKSKTGNRRPVSRFARDGRSSPAISPNLNSMEDPMTPTSFGTRSLAEGLTVIGEAAHDASPEVIELSFEIHSVALNAASALQENATKARQIGQALGATDNAEAQITTGAAPRKLKGMMTQAVKVFVRTDFQNRSAMSRQHDVIHDTFQICAILLSHNL